MTRNDLTSRRGPCGKLLMETYGACSISGTYSPLLAGSLPIQMVAT